MTYFKRPDAVPPPKAKPVSIDPDDSFGLVEVRVNCEKRCSRCRQWKKLPAFEVKGRNTAGQQVRRGVCNDCRRLRHNEKELARPDQETERTCKTCGETYKMSEFGFCGDFYATGLYRRWTCRLCRREYARALGALKKWKKERMAE